jgi:PP-loop superfamily ATP-utilizing enzyme
MSGAASAKVKRDTRWSLLRASSPLVIAYSGGVDKCFLSITAAVLGMTERAEAVVRSFGFRVRHHVQGSRLQARVEILPNEMPRLESVDGVLVNARYYCWTVA